MPWKTLSRRLLLPALAVLAAFALGAPAAASAATFSNTDGITINTPSGTCPPPPATASPYPSTIAVSGVSGTISDVNVTIGDLTHSFPRDVGILLVGPAGQSTILMQDSGGGSPAGVDLTFDDAAASEVPNPTTSGTYRPTRGNIGCLAPSSYPGPAPAGPYGSTLGVFNGTDPNGTWSLYVIDDAGGDSGSIGSWSLDVTTAPDTTAPGVVMSSAAPDPTNASPIAVTAQFSEPVTGFAAADVVAGNATVGNFVAVDGDTYTFDLTPSGQGLATADIAAGAAQDGAGNPSTAAAQFSRTFDSVAPAVSCSASPASLKSNNHKLVSITTSVTVTDGGSGAAGFTLVSVLSSQADSGLAGGDQPDDIQGWTTGTADTSGLLRTERYGGDRVYTLTYQGSDVAGNTATCQTTVTVS